MAKAKAESVSVAPGMDAPGKPHLEEI